MVYGYRQVRIFQIYFDHEIAFLEEAAQRHQILHLEMLYSQKTVQMPEVYNWAPTSVSFGDQKDGGVYAQGLVHPLHCSFEEEILLLHPHQLFLLWREAALRRSKQTQRRGGGGRSKLQPVAQDSLQDPGIPC